MWVPPEDKDPVTRHAPTRKSIAMFGAVNVRTGRLVTMISPVFNAETFEHFLQKLIRHRSKSRRCVVVLDNARYHHASMLCDFLQYHRSHFRLDFLPPYSLNSIERVWKLLRKLCIHNQYFETLDDLIRSVSHQTDLWACSNPVLHNLCRII